MLGSSSDPPLPHPDDEDIEVDHVFVIQDSSFYGDIPSGSIEIDNKWIRSDEFIEAGNGEVVERMRACGDKALFEGNILYRPADT